MNPRSRTVLFLCTGNYFRSRLAERLFNHLARGAGLPWVATSRALAPHPEQRNPGPISAHTLEALRRRGISDDVDRGPLEASEGDLRRGDLVIALNEPEHRPLVAARFPRWEERVEYWRCVDIDVAGPEIAVAGVATEVELLARRLQDS
jgi:protein-tyrosine-phosphatase